MSSVFIIYFISNISLYALLFQNEKTFTILIYERKRLSKWNIFNKRQASYVTCVDNASNILCDFGLQYVSKSRHSKLRRFEFSNKILTNCYLKNQYVYLLSSAVYICLPILAMKLNMQKKLGVHQNESTALNTFFSKIYTKSILLQMLTQKNISHSRLNAKYKI